MDRPRAHLALPTALHDDGTVDRDGHAALAERAAAAACDAVTVLDAAQGELHLLDHDERALVLDASRAGAGGLPVVAGVDARAADAVGWAHRAVGAGASSLLVLDGGPGAATERLAAIGATGVPTWLHVHPAAAGSAADLDRVLTVASDLGLAGVVLEAPPVLDGIEALRAGGLAVHGGLAGLLLPDELEAGATGSSAATAVPELLTRCVRADGATARRDAHLAAAGYLHLEVGSAGLRVRKEAWRQRGVIRSARCRAGAPLGATTKRAVGRRLRDAGIELGAPYPDG
jgi:4-hydroxy-tetrahydrodipicolinate synthase